MIPYEEAYVKMLELKVNVAHERIDLIDCCGRVLQEDLCADIDMPPFNRVAMDGYACRREDLSDILAIIEEVPAGQKPQKKVDSKTCTQIYTGCELPLGANCVIKIEDCQRTADKVRFLKNQTEANFFLKGSDVRRGELVLPKGTIIAPQHLGILATYGHTKPLVNQKIAVGVMVSGNEIVEPDRVPLAAQIRNANACLLLAALQELNCNVKYYGICKDNYHDMLETFNRAAQENQIVLFSGAMSKGNYDFGPQIFKDSHYHIIVQNIAHQPGKPVVIAHNESGKVVFGVPGNPVSTFVVFQVLIKPFIRNIINAHCLITNIKGVLSETIYHADLTRKFWAPVMWNNNGEVTTVPYNSSGHIDSLLQVQGFVPVPVGIAEIKKGETVWVMTLS